MIDGVNDRPSDAVELAALCRRLRPAAHVNLIPLNPTPGWPTKGHADRRGRRASATCWSRSASTPPSAATAAPTSTPPAVSWRPVRAERVLERANETARPRSRSAAAPRPAIDETVRAQLGRARRADPRPRPHRDAPRRHARARRRLADRRPTVSGGSSSAPTAAARRRCCESPPSTSTRPPAPWTCSVSGSAAPTCACCAGASATPPPPSPTKCGRRSRALDAVRTARYAALEPWWHQYTADDDARALECLERMGVARFAERAIESLSSGERQRVLLGQDPHERSGRRPARRAVGPTRPRRARAARPRAR